MNTRTIEVGGIKTSYMEEGSGDAVLFVHGLAGYKENWDANVPVFSERYRALALDLPGYGKSDKPDVPYSPPWFAEFVGKFLEALGIERAHLVGNSMGGHICSLVAATQKGITGKVILADPTGIRGKELAETGPITPDMIEAMGPINPGEDFIRMYIDLQFYKPGHYTETMLRRALADMELGEMDIRFNAYMKSLRALIAHDMVPLYKDIEAPTLVIWGENDMIVPAENAEIAASAIAGVKKIVMPECGHLPMIEKPDEFNRLSLEFLG